MGEFKGEFKGELEGEKEQVKKLACSFFLKSQCKPQKRSKLKVRLVGEGAS